MYYGVILPDGGLFCDLHWFPKKPTLADFNLTEGQIRAFDLIERPETCGTPDSQ